VTAARVIAASICVAAAVTMVGALACAKAAAGYEDRLQLQLAQAYRKHCDVSSPSPSLAARAGLRVRGSSVAADRLELGARLLRLGATRSCTGKGAATAETQSSNIVAARIPYDGLLDRARALARRDGGKGRADTLGLLGLTLIRVSEIDPANAETFVEEAESVSRDAVRLRPSDSLLQTNLEVVLRMRRQDEQSRRRQGHAQQQTKAHARSQQQHEQRKKHRPLPGPGRNGAGGY